MFIGECKFPFSTLVFCMGIRGKLFFFVISCGASSQGTTVRVEFGDATTVADPADAHIIARAFPHNYAQPLAHFLRATAKVPDAQIITEHPAIRCAFHSLSHSLCVYAGTHKIIHIDSCPEEYEFYSHEI